MSTDEGHRSPLTHAQKALDPFRAFWYGIEPFYGGKSAIPAHQTSLYYTRASPEGDVHRHIDFSKAGADDLAALYEACKPAAFGRNRETVLDDSYRKARKLDLDAFATLFDPRSVGILEQVSHALLPGKRGSSITEMELYKLNVYGEGDFFKAHKDTPRSENMIGSLVVVLPTKHEGGQLVLRHGTQEWTLDFADTLATATEPSVCFIAFFGDVEHEVLPVTSGYRVTLTYNLYRQPSRPSTSCIPTPFHAKFKKALVELINDKSTLPRGGYLGCGLVHEYVFTEGAPMGALFDQLKGLDQVLVTICEELNLQCSLKLLYRDLCDSNLNLTVRNKSAFWIPSAATEGEIELLENAVYGSSIEDVEGVEIVGHPIDPEMLEDEFPFLQPFYRDPVTQILEIRPTSSVEVAEPYVTFGNDACLRYLYGRVYLLIGVDPAATREELKLTL